MSKLNLRSALRIFVITFFLMVIGQSLHAATLRWENDVVDWATGVILGVDDLYVAPLEKAYDVNFVDGFDPLPVYGIDPTFQGEIYPNAGSISGHQLFSLRDYFYTLSNSNIDPRLINGINERSSGFNQGTIGALHNYNWANIGQMQINFITIFLNSSDMAIGGGFYNPSIFEEHHTTEDIAWATFEESSTVPIPSSIIFLGFGLLGLTGVYRRKK